MHLVSEGFVLAFASCSVAFGSTGASSNVAGGTTPVASLIRMGFNPSKNFVIFFRSCTDSVPGRPDLASVDRAHRKTPEIAETWSFRKERKCSLRADITAMMSTRYTGIPVEPPRCLTPGRSGPGRHHGHDVDRRHSRMSTWEVNIQFTRLTSQGVMSTGQTRINEFQNSVECDV
ncbi:hypothetical protein AAC387_Pa02g1925 [Persea americana]